MAAAFAGLSLLTLLQAGCSSVHPTAAAPHDHLSPGVVYAADLDGDGKPERIFLDRVGGLLTITDGDVVYHSRAKWHVAEAVLGDTDHDGHLEVVTLLDDAEGRHIGLFASYGGKIRERLVTHQLTPRPLTLDVVSLDASGTAVTAAPGASSADAVLLTVQPASGSAGPHTILYRWNGFGYTAIATS